MIGSIPTAFIFGKLLKGIDIRKFGSGNVGATNALRVMGKGAGILVLLLDILKGVIPIFLSQIIVFRMIDFPVDIFRILMGVSCICGHNWSLFLNFKGGKGIAATLGVFIGLALKTPGLGIILIMVVLSWLLVFMFSRIVSLSSIIAALILPLLVHVFKQSRLIFIASLVLSFFVILRHKSNITRLLQGKESRLNFNKKA
ncbi:MAG: glycerol-3-phosphate 1-O-acyltransferase PlsY [Candidatus Omnitrophica bacterium]|nr:glycerol-3-phosphate 1-O-acyltransferase PlsY [Candidatus Omnitrophota bacterium]